MDEGDEKTGKSFLAATRAGGEAITQENLPAALERGDITDDEVEEIWSKTSFLSAQTPIEFRIAIIKLEDAGLALDPLHMLVLSQMMDIRAAMTKDTSTFHHLVAGTETIVKTLQNVNPLMRILEQQAALIDDQFALLERMEAKMDAMMQAMAEGGRLEIKHEVLHGGDEEAEYLAQTAADALNSPVAEPTEETYDGNVGSAWDPKNPAKGPVKLPTASQEFETQSQQFRQRILKHS